MIEDYLPYILENLKKTYPFFDIEEIKITSIDKYSSKIEICYDYKVYSRFDRKWHLSKTGKMILDIDSIRNDKLEKLLN
jgi:hypothetical protein